MDLDEAANLISRFRGLPIPPGPEPTIFSIGGKGYFENPTTDLLAFFCDPEGPHQFGTTVLEALFDCLGPNERPQSLKLTSPPVREQVTGEGRMDLLLDSEDWVLALENKIFHEQNNPFDDYKAYVDNWRGQKQGYCVVLSLDGQAPEGWHGVTYAELIFKLRENIAPLLLKNPVNKWSIYFRDFLLNLEQTVTNVHKVPDETLNFFLEHLDDLDAINKMKDQTVQSLQNDIHSWLQESLGDETLRDKRETWKGFPALRFYREGQYENSSAVLFLDGRGGSHYCVQFFICSIGNDAQRAQADEIGLSFPDIQTSWDEYKKTIRGYSRPLPSIDVGTMKVMLKEVLEKLSYFEREVRPSWRLPR